MKLAYVIGVLGILTVACTTSPAQIQAADAPNILILGETADDHSIPRYNRVYERVQDALTNQLIQKGFTVVDETAATLNNSAQNRIRRADPELIDIARSITRPPVDVVLIFTIYASVEEKEYTGIVHTRIQGRLLDVKAGTGLGNFEVGSPNTWRVALSCDYECVIESTGDKAKILSRDLGEVLGDLVDARLVSAGLSGSIADDGEKGGLPTAYTLVFDNISVDEMHDISSYLVTFKGYEHHRTIEAMTLHHEVWYETSIDSARLTRNLQKMLEHLGIKGRVVYPHGRAGIYGIEKLPTAN